MKTNSVHKFFSHIDIPLLCGIVILCAIGLTVLYSASNENIDIVIKQSIKLMLAFLFMLLVAQISPAAILRLTPNLYIFGVLLLILVFFVGVVSKGAQRWLDLGFFRFQPSELMKLLVPMAVAYFLANKPLPPKLGNIFYISIIILIPAFLIAKQPDLGTALLISLAGFSVLFIAGISWKLLSIISGILAACAPLLWHFMHDYQKRRVLTFLNPESDPLNSGYHIIQSKIAIGSGGLYGKGWLNGTQSQLQFLPERTTDFIFAVFCEEFGLIGVLILLCVYLFVIFRSLYIAINAQHIFNKLLASGLTLIFFICIYVNIGMVTGQLPVVGVPLPLISYGGTSIITLMIGFGILMSIKTHKRSLYL